MNLDHLVRFASNDWKATNFKTLPWRVLNGGIEFLGKSWPATLPTGMLCGLLAGVTFYDLFSTERQGVVLEEWKVRAEEDHTKYRVVDDTQATTAYLVKDLKSHDRYLLLNSRDVADPEDNIEFIRPGFTLSTSVIDEEGVLMDYDVWGADGAVKTN